MAGKTVRIGGATGHTFDSLMGVPQLISGSPQVDYLVMDYLSEGVMAMFARMIMMDPSLGYATDIVTAHIGPYLAEIAAKKIKVIANAGGLNSKGCVEALEKVAREKGLKLNIAYVEGDDLRGRIGEFQERGVTDMFTGEPLPKDKILSVNAYFGAFPIAAALNAGADIVITGRVVDSAPSLAALIHEFGWTETDYDKLSSGTLVGHLLECGCQSTGGTFTDWEDVPDWADMGFPIAECSADGSFVLTKPEGTGGLVSVGTVAEQLLYEVSDPQAYFAPDVVCDMTTMKLEQVGPNRVRCSNATGYAPSDTYKVCVTYDGGWRCTAFQPIAGIDAARKAEKQATALFDRVGKMLQQRNLPPFSLTHHDAWGSGASFGARADAPDAREVVCRMVVDHPDKAGADLFAREQHAVMCGMSVGSTILFSVNVLPVSRLTSFLLDKDEVPVRVVMNGQAIEAHPARKGGFNFGMVPRPQVEPAPALTGSATTVPLIRLAFARSGDKGRLFNVGVIARQPEYLPYIRAALTTGAVTEWYAHSFDNPNDRRVDRYEVPGFHAINFVVHNSLGGGLTGTARVDAAAKTMAQQLMDFPVPVPAELAARLGGQKAAKPALATA